MLKLIFNLFKKRFVKYLVSKDEYIKLIEKADESFKKRVITYLNKENGIKLTVKNLAFAFHDLDGNAYYKFAKETELPIIRTAKVQEFLMWLIKGVSKEEYIKLIEKADDALVKGISDQKGTSKIGFVLHELKDRCNMVVHPELFYNIIAAQVIRADEEPGQFNNDIHMEKVEALKAMDIINDGFFLAIRELLVPLGLLNITSVQLEVLLKESQARVLATERILNSL